MAEVNPKELKRVDEQLKFARDRIRFFRSRRGLTQSQLSVLMGVTKTRISDLEAGMYDAQLSTYLRACRALGVSMSEFFDGCPWWSR